MILEHLKYSNKLVPFQLFVYSFYFICVFIKNQFEPFINH